MSLCNNLDGQEFMLFFQVQKQYEGKTIGVESMYTGNEATYGLYGMWCENEYVPPAGTILFKFHQLHWNKNAFTLTFDGYNVANTPLGLIGDPNVKTTFYITNLSQLDNGCYACNLQMGNEPYQYVVNQDVNGLCGVHTFPANTYNPYFTLVPKMPS